MADASYRDGMRVMLPLIPAVLAFGASFGVLARAAGVDSLAPLGGVAILLRTPLLVVVLVAAATAAGLRAL